MLLSIQEVIENNVSVIKINKYLYLKAYSSVELLPCLFKLIFKITFYLYNCFLLSKNKVVSNRNANFKQYNTYF